MIASLWVILFIASGWVLAYKRASLSVWTLAIFFYLLIISQFSELGLASKTAVWVLYALTASALNIRPLRQRLFTQRILAFYQKVKPSLSTTEKEALGIGTVGWEGELFSGMPQWQLLKNYPAPALSAEEKLFLDEEVEQLCQMLNNWKISHYHLNLPTAVWQFLKQRGFFGLIIPKQYGGKQFSAFAHSAVIVKIAGHSNAAATVVSVPNSLGPAELLLEYGTEQQKEHYLPRLACGDEIPCFALTEPEAGSDASAITSHGIVCKDHWEGQEIIGVRLNWHKRYITLAPVATLLGLAFKLFDPNHLLGEQEEYGITCALIPTRTPGVVIGRRHLPMNCTFPNGPTQGENVFIPLDYLIGGPAMAGKGWHMLIERLSVGRAITLPSLSTGGAKVAAFTTGAYARVRKQFHLPLEKFEGIQEALTRIAGHTYIMDATRLLGISAVDRGEQPAVPSAISKYHTTELARRVINDAMDVHGGKGVCMGPRNYLAQGYMEAPIAVTVEGANILTRCVIIFGQGIMRCHPYLLRELTAAQNPDRKQALQDFDQAIMGHLGFLISNHVRAFLLAITHGKLAGGMPTNHPALKHYYQQLNRFSAAFALIADVAVLSLGKGLKSREHLSGRLSDVLSMLYMGSAVLKHFENQGNPSEDLPLLEWSCQTLLFQLQTALDAALRNFPKRGVGKLLRACIFPLGCRLKPPADTLSHRVAILLSSDSTTRVRLTAGTYLAADMKNSVGLVGAAFKTVLATQQIEDKIQSAVCENIISGKNWPAKIAAALALGLITAGENQLLQQADAARKEISAVDDFAPEE